MRMKEYETRHLNELRKIAPECTVLLKRSGAFPLSGVSEIALYGSGARHTKKGGTGSGDVNVRSFSTIEKALLDEGFVITTSSWLDSYDGKLALAEEEHLSSLRKRIEKGGLRELLSSMGESVPEPEYDIEVEKTCDTALYVLSRQSGEGTDRKNCKGDFLLTESERRDILLISRLYRRFMLVLNTAGVIDLSPVVSSVPDILLLSQLGEVTGECLADLLLGRSYPSGKLTATWAEARDYPDAGTYRGVNDTYYREGILVGYRWFDAVGKAPLFPFGFGLGYTDFSIFFNRVIVCGNTVSIDVTVENTGSCPGRECVQVYVSKPQGRLYKAPKDLVAYKKTGELARGEKESMTISFDMALCASFDEETSSLLLERGDYILLPGSSSCSVTPSAVLRISEDTTVRYLHEAGGNAPDDDFCPEYTPFSSDGLPVIDFHYTGSGSVSSVEAFSEEVMETVSSLSDEELVSVCIGKYSEGGQSIIGNAGSAVAGGAGETTGKLEKYGRRSLVLADGPAGIRIASTYFEDENGSHSLDNGTIDRLLKLLPPSLFPLIGEKTVPTGEIRHHWASAIPVATALAQSFNPSAQAVCGDIVGEEMEEFGIDIWLAPACNIQRDVLCGRNFEYYSEDPVVSGRTAAAVITAVQAHKGKGVTLKHFCCNNQETNRFRSNSVVSGRTLREIYLRPFEIAVRESRPLSVMSSYNLLNGIHTAERRDLLETVLRSEWGFTGVVMSDWVVDGISMGTGDDRYEGQSAPLSIAAGNDLVMPGSASDYDRVLQALKSGELEKERLVVSASRIMRLIDFCSG